MAIKKQITFEKRTYNVGEEERVAAELALRGSTAGGHFSYASATGVPILAVAGQVEAEVKDRINNISLTEEFDEYLSMTETTQCIKKAVGRFLENFEV